MTANQGNHKRDRLETIALWLIAGALGIYFSGGMLPPLFHLLGLDSLADMFLTAYGTTCHQLSERTFFLSGTRFGLCARCLGFYGGLLLGAVFVAIRRPTAGPKPLLVLIFAAVTLIDVLFELTPESNVGNWLRLLIGLPTGFLLAVWALTKLKATSIAAT